LTAALTRGTKVAGGLGVLSEAPLNARTNIELAAGDVAVFDCAAAGFPSVSALVVQDARIKPAPQSGGAVPPTGAAPPSRIAWPSSLEITPGQGSELNWEMRGPLVIATRSTGTTARERDPAVLRPLLDRVVLGHQAPLLVPVTQIQIAFAASQDWRAGYERIPNVVLTSAEAVPAQPRAAQPVNCEASNAAEQRKLHEAMVALDALPRSGTRVMGLAENAVRREHDIFKLGVPGSIWAVAGDVGTFDHYDALTPPPEDGKMSPDPLELVHSMQVAGLLVAQVSVRGLLDDGSIAWVNTNDTLLNNLHLIDRLTERRSVVNVSVRLDESWGPIEGEGLRRPAFHDGLLLIAAAANLDKPGQHGPPISWRLPNVIGVGVVDAGKNIPAGAKYSRADIDLVAPGVRVPLHKMDGGMECLDGTSFATAHVTAVAALFPEGTQRDAQLLRARLLATADWLPAYAGKVRGGLLNARRALQHLDKNVLIVNPAPGAQDETLTAKVPEVGAGAFEVSTEVDGLPVNRKIHWTRLLRLQRLSDAGAAEANFRIVYVNDNALVIHDTATIAASVKAPFVTCKTITGGEATCDKMPVHVIKDYIAQYYTSPIAKF
jgi:hypothetical protein